VEIGQQTQTGGSVEKAGCVEEVCSCGEEVTCQQNACQAYRQSTFEEADHREQCEEEIFGEEEGAKEIVKIQIAWIGKTKEPAIRALTDEYLTRISRYVPAESLEMAAEPALLEKAEDTTGRTRPVLVLLDSRGRQFTSEEFAELLRDQQDRGTQNLFFAVGPADGFSDRARSSADLVLSFGKMTLAHELARIVLLEQIYRAFTILKGHPYHTGH
jgi:23S rRNA (pseudouridine1915-N3)-methyltransferase